MATTLSPARTSSSPVAGRWLRRAQSGGCLCRAATDGSARGLPNLVPTPFPGGRRVAGGAVSGDLCTRVGSSPSERQEGRAQNLKAEVRETGERVADVAAAWWLRERGRHPPETSASTRPLAASVQSPHARIWRRKGLFRAVTPLPALASARASAHSRSAPGSAAGRRGAGANCGLPDRRSQSLLQGGVGLALRRGVVPSRQAPCGRVHR
jgi:hypothetical protein